MWAALAWVGQAAVYAAGELAGFPVSGGVGRWPRPPDGV
jgi:hypothetical protein